MNNLPIVQADWTRISRRWRRWPEKRQHQERAFRPPSQVPGSLAIAPIGGGGKKELEGRGGRGVQGCLQGPEVLAGAEVEVGVVRVVEIKIRSTCDG